MTNTNVGDAPQRPLWEEATPGEAKHALEYIRTLYRRRILAISSFVIVVAIMSLRTLPQEPVYIATSRLLLYFNQSKLVAYETLVEDTSSEDQTPVLMLKSRALAKRVIETVSRQRPAMASAAANEGVGSKILKIIEPIRRWPSRPVSGADLSCLAASNTPEAQAAATDCFLSALTIAPVASSNLVDIAFRSSDPAAAAAYANALAEAFVQENQQTQSQASKEAADWLTKQVNEQRQRMEASEQALQQYRAHAKITSPDDPANPVIQRLNEMTTELIRAKTERIEKEAVAERIAAAGRNPAQLSEIPQIQRVPAVQQVRNDLMEARARFTAMSETLGERHPDLLKARAQIDVLNARLRAEVVAAAESLTAQFENARLTEEGLTESSNTQKRMAIGLKSDAGQAAVLESDSESDKQIYQYLLSRDKQSKIAAQARVHPSRVVDAADVPTMPITPSIRTNLIYAVAMGLILSIGLVVLFDYFDERLKDPHEIEAQLGLVNLGLVPQVPLKTGEKLLGENVSRFIEAFKSIRTNVQYVAGKTDGCKTIAITSSGPREGKTTIAVNLAISLAQTGDRVLLIDGDLRRPDVHRRLKLPQEPGISNYLLGAGTAPPVMQKATAGLVALTCGTIPANPAELLGGKKFRDLFAQLKTQFDWIIVDTPPVMAVSDAVVLAGMVDGVMFVVATDKTNRQVAKLSVKRLETASCRFFGAVLNQVDIERHPYYYARYYRRDYDGYYAKMAG